MRGLWTLVAAGTQSRDVTTAHLVTERLFRPLARRALASGVAERTRVRSVAGRTMFAWVLGTGVMLWGLAAPAHAADPG